MSHFAEDPLGYISSLQSTVLWNTHFYKITDGNTNRGGELCHDVQNRIPNNKLVMNKDKYVDQTYYF